MMTLAEWIALATGILTLVATIIALVATIIASRAAGYARDAAESAERTENLSAMNAIVAAYSAGYLQDASKSIRATLQEATAARRESRADRRLRQLERVASPLADLSQTVVALKSNPQAWQAFRDTQGALRSALAPLSAADLPMCHQLAEVSGQAEGLMPLAEDARQELGEQLKQAREDLNRFG